ncbi:Transcription initiation factor TFIID subunit 12 [Lasiodiplodia theobromae]|uniref:Transcription initiation factor TFIID subunit 12 n=1 Tax=Lasiodiplodia theobromae TaxID=45133 RepID=A0A5N5CU79_9PEZI|nr:Transcription initiation factor TFIID subunit 12 [Lasiodiplodia theobromae]
MSQQQARPLPPGIRVNQIQTLPHLTDQQKATYTRGVASLYEAFQKHDKESPEYKTAAAKLLEFTKKMGKEMNEWKAAQAAAAGGAGGGGQPAQQAQQQQAQADRPQSQGQPAQQPPQQNQGQPAHPGGGTQLPAQIVQHINSFPFQLPPNIPTGTPEAETKLREVKNHYASMLHRQEQLANNLKKMTAMMQERQSNGQEIPPNWLSQKPQMEAQYNQVKRSVAEFRKNQEQLKQNAMQNQQSQQSQPQQQPQQQQHPQQPPQQQQPKPPVQQQQPQAAVQQTPQQPQQTPQQPNGQQIKPETPVAPPTPAQSQQPMQMGGQPGHPSQQPQQGGQNQPLATNPAVHAARQQQPPMSPANAGSQPPGQPAFSGQVTPQGGQMQQQQNMNQQRPPLNPQQASQMNQMQHSPHPPSANPNGPIPLTHGQAMANAARTYSDSRGTPQIPAAQGYQSIGNRTDQMTNPKMPIPKTLNAPPPHPVTMGPARPTLGGPSNGAPGMMGQPVIAGHPQYHLEGDENRVLSKKKLDELVRQVTGSGEPTGEALSPEVEEAMLQLADDFLDNVVSSACKLAKLRESSQLEIRDIQNILERNYNIRIPGYASDEIRTVRKFQPAPGWTQKMNAVQAAKVMGGKTD